MLMNKKSSNINNRLQNDVLRNVLSCRLGNFYQSFERSFIFHLQG